MALDSETLRNIADKYQAWQQAHQVWSELNAIRKGMFVPRVNDKLRKAHSTIRYLDGLISQLRYYQKSSMPSQAWTLDLNIKPKRETPKSWRAAIAAKIIELNTTKASWAAHAKALRKPAPTASAEEISAAKEVLDAAKREFFHTIETNLEKDLTAIFASERTKRHSATDYLTRRSAYAARYKDSEEHTELAADINQIIDALKPAAAASTAAPATPSGGARLERSYSFLEGVGGIFYRHSPPEQTGAAATVSTHEPSTFSAPTGDGSSFAERMRQLFG